MTDDPRIAALPDIHGHAKGEHKPFAEERPIPYTARMLFLWFFHACRRASPRFLMVADHMNYLTFEDPAAVNLVRRALKLAQAGDLYGAAETAGVELGHAAAVSEGLRRGMRYSIGAEIDNDPRCRPDAQNIVDAMRPDGMIRSVHFLPIAHPEHGENWMWAFDNPEFKELYEVVGTERTWEIYMATILDAIDKLPGNILGHFYVPAKFGHWPDDGMLESYEDRMLDACAARGMAVEVNSRYFYKFYAGDDAQVEKYRSVHLRLLRKAKAKGVLVAVGSDAHSPKDQGGAFDVVLALLDEAEINEIAFPINGRLARVALRVTEEVLRQHAAVPAPLLAAQTTLSGSETQTLAASPAAAGPGPDVEVLSADGAVERPELASVGSARAPAEITGSQPAPAGHQPAAQNGPGGKRRRAPAEAVPAGAATAEAVPASAATAAPPDKAADSYGYADGTPEPALERSERRPPEPVEGETGSVAPRPKKRAATTRRRAAGKVAGTAADDTVGTDIVAADIVAADTVAAETTEATALGAETMAAVDETVIASAIRNAAEAVVAIGRDSQADAASPAGRVDDDAVVSGRQRKPAVRSRRPAPAAESPRRLPAGTKRSVADHAAGKSAPKRTLPAGAKPAAVAAGNKTARHDAPRSTKSAAKPASKAAKPPARSSGKATAKASLGKDGAKKSAAKRPAAKKASASPVARPVKGAKKAPARKQAAAKVSKRTLVPKRSGGKKAAAKKTPAKKKASKTRR